MNESPFSIYRSQKIQQKASIFEMGIFIDTNSQQNIANPFFLTPKHLSILSIQFLKHFAPKTVFFSEFRRIGHRCD